MLRSLRSQLTLLLVGLLLLLAVFTGYATLNTMRNDSEQQARQLLKVASNAAGQTLQVRSDQLTDSVRLLAADFGFRQAVATAEAETISSVLDNHGARINADLAFLFTPDGRMLASTAAVQDNAVLPGLFEQARAQQGSQASVLSVGERAYQLVLVPVRAPHIIAWVGMGFSVDQQLASQIADLTGLQVSFIRLSGERLVLSSTLSAAAKQQLAEQLQPIMLDERVLPELLPQHISQLFALSETQQLWGVLHLPNAQWLANYQALRNQLLQIFSLGLALALVVAFVYTRSVTRPLDKLVRYAKAIGRGQEVQPPAVALAEVGLLANTLTQMRAAIQQRERQLLEQVERDPLTGLANRLAVEKHLAARLQQQASTLLLLNIAKFRYVNDSLGYHSGDLLLQQLALRLNNETTINFCARLGADEFLLVIPSTLEEEQINSLLVNLAQPFDLAGSAINLQLVAGVYATTALAQDVNAILRRLEIALANAKADNLPQAWYRTGQDESHQRELTLIRDLPQALDSGQFSVVFQPKVDIVARRCRAAEALIRWQHPTLGFVSPMEFITLAERTGNISLISNWMLQQVIRQLASWQQLHPQVAVAVNLSAADLLDDALPARILAALAEAAVPVSALTLEVTESAVMQDASRAIANLKVLKQAGIKLAIDDFGTGQSSLAYLKNLPVHEVKIDRAFIKDIEHNQQDALIVQATAQLAGGLGLTVTAEGLENHAGLSRVLDAGCQQVQGYYFAKPLSAKDFSQWLQDFATQGERFFPPAVDPATAPIAAQ